MKRHKAAGPDKTVTEMIASLEEYGVSKVTGIINEIYNAGEIPEDLSRSIFIALPKKPGTFECELHRNISLISLITKLILSMIVERVGRIRQKIGIEQCGFVEDTAMRKQYLCSELYLKELLKNREMSTCVSLITPKSLTGYNMMNFSRC